MDYKKIIPNREIRLRILRLLSFVPDHLMLKIQYRMKMGRKLNLDNPQRFTEKIQWYKLYYRDPLMKRCVDKYDVRDYVRECGLEDILVPLIGVYSSESDVQIDALPEKCVIKDTLGGGGNSVVLFEKAANIDIHRLYAQMKNWINADTSYRTGGREWPYGGKKHRIIIEEMLPSKTENGGLIDYKFFCFNGEPKIVYVIADRKVGEKAGFGIFTADYNKLAVARCDEKPLEREIPKPKNYERMLEISRLLSKPFPEVRIDLYNLDGEIYFGEMTFFDGSGYMSFEPDSFDFTLGNAFDLPEKKGV